MQSLVLISKYLETKVQILACWKRVHPLNIQFTFVLCFLFNCGLVTAYGNAIDS